MLFNPEVIVWLYNQRVDMRKSINGLSIIVASNMLKNPTNQGELFLFCNKGGDKLKILYWQKNGFCLWYKRLEKGSFKIPTELASINYEQLQWLLEGLDIRKFEGHKRLSYEKFY